MALYQGEKLLAGGINGKSAYEHALAGGYEGSETEFNAFLATAEEKIDKIPTQLSELSDDNTHRLVTDAEKEVWNAKSEFSGNYNDLTNKPTIPSIDGKVDKVDGKGLSTNDYTTDDKNKLAGIADGAEVNVNADWNATSGDAQILNKPALGALAGKNEVKKADLASDVQDSLTKADNAIPVSIKGEAGGLAELDASGKVPISQLPSYVDDVIESSSKSLFPTIGETGKIYVDTSANITYRWSGSAYIEISASLALGETSSTAYRGDRGKIAYDHSQSAHAPSNAEKNQNAFSNIAVSGQTTVAADSATDTLTLVAGSNVTITTDATNDKVTISATNTDTNTTYDLAASKSSTNGDVKLNLTAGGSGSGTDSVTIKGSGATSVTTDANGIVTISSTDNNTHHTANLITGASASAKTNAAASNGSVYMNLVENDTVRNSHNIVGTGTVTVASDANGKITINGTAHPTALKNPNALTIQVNGTTLTNGVYDGSAAKTVNITASSIGAASNATYTSATMNASSWSGNTYSFESTYPKAQYDISIEVAPTATITQFEAFCSAMICGSHDSNIATAIGDAPTIDIPIIIKVVRK